MAATTFRDIKAWQAAYTVVLTTYRLTAAFPKSETYGLTSQLRRAAVSIALNITEGFKRRSTAEALRFYNIAEASLEETKCAFLIAKDLKYLTSQDHDEALQLCETAGRLLNGWMRSNARST